MPSRALRSDIRPGPCCDPPPPATPGASEAGDPMSWRIICPGHQIAAGDPGFPRLRRATVLLAAPCFPSPRPGCACVTQSLAEHRNSPRR